jgi:DHA1 family bicyclomycin/chloramphenicol resistance-like MFS transporter
MPNRQRSETRYIIMLGLLLGSQPVATDLYLPALPSIAGELGNPALTLTGLLLAFGFAQLILGPLSDRYGRRPVLLAGCAGYALASFAGAWVTSLSGLIVCRCLQGAAMAALIVCARASVRDLYAPVEGMRALSKGLTGLGLVALCAPVTGALVVAYWSWHAAFIALGVYGLIMLFWVWANFTESLPERAPIAANAITKSASLAVLKGPRFRAWTAMLVATYCTLFAFLLSSGFVYIKVFGFSPLACGLVLGSNSLAYIGGTYFCRNLLARMGPDGAARIGGMISLTGGLSMLAVALVSGPQPWSMILGQWLIAIAHGVHQPCGQAGSVGDFPEHAGRAAAFSGFGMMLAAFFCGQFMAPSLGTSAWPLVLSNAIGSVCISIVAWVFVPWAYRGQTKHSGT